MQMKPSKISGLFPKVRVVLQLFYKAIVLVSSIIQMKLFILKKWK